MVNELDRPDVGRATEHAYRTIRGQILSGERSGGEWLRESDLVSATGVSRTPVREALQRLAAEGLVLHERNRGARVQRWSATDLEEIFNLRSLLEPWGYHLAAISGSFDLGALERTADEMSALAAEESPNFSRITELNNQFHGAILDAAGSPRLVGLVSAVVQVPLVRRTFSNFSGAALQRSMAHHHEIVESLRARDPLWAESTMRSHIRAAWASISDEPTELTVTRLSPPPMPGIGVTSTGKSGSD